MSSTHTDEMSDCISATSVHDLVTPEKAQTTTTTTAVIPQSSLEVSPLHPRLVTHGRRPAHGTQSRTTTTATTLSNNNNHNSRSSITTSKSLAGSRSHNNGPSLLTTNPAGQLTEDELRAVQEYTHTEAEQPTTTASAPATTLKSRWRGLLASVVAVEDSIVRHLSSSPPAPSAARELAGPRRSSSHAIASEIITQTTTTATLDSEKSHDDTNREVVDTNGFSPAPTQPHVQQQPATSDTVNVETTAKGTAGRHRRNPRRRRQSAIDATAHATTMTLINDVAAEAAIRRPASGTLSSLTGSNNGATHPPTFIVRNTRSSSLRSGLTHPTVTTNTTTSPIPTAKRMYTPVHETETTLTATTRTTITTTTESGQSPVQRGRSRSQHHDDPYAHVHSVVRDYRTNQIDQLAAAYRAARVSGSVLTGRPSSAEELLLLSPPPRRVPGAHSLEPGLTTPQSQIQPHYYYYNSSYIHNNNNINVQSSSAQRHGSRRRSQPSSHHPPSRDAGTEASMIEVSRSTSAGEANSRTVVEDEEEEEEETARTLTMTQTGSAAGVAVKDVTVAAAVPEKMSDVEDTSSSNRKRAVSFHEEHHYAATNPVEEDTPRPLARRLTSGQDAHTPRTRTRSRTTTRTMSASVTPRRRLTAAEQAELYVQEQMQLRRQRQPSPYRANIPVPTPWRPSSPRPAEQRKWQREVVKAGQQETRRQMSRQVTTPRYHTPAHNQHQQQVKQEGKVVVRAHSASLVPRCASIIPARYRTSSRPITTANRTLSAENKASGSAEAFRGRTPFTVSPLPREGRVNHHRSPPRVRAEPVLINTSKQQQQTKEMLSADTEAVKGNKYNGGRRPSAFASIPPPPPPTNSDTFALLAEGNNKGVARPLLSPPHAGPVERGTLRKDKTPNKATARCPQVDMSSFQSRLLFALNPPSLVNATR